MGATESKTQMPKNGGKWNSTIYFNPKADNKAGGKEYEITDKELNKKMKKLIDNEMIVEIFLCKVSLFGWQLSNLIMYHAFVVIHTNEWWWSVEKNTEGITIQRSKKKMFVQDFYRGIKRASRCKVMKEDHGKSYDECGQLDLSE